MAARTLTLEATIAQIRRFKVFLCYDDLRGISMWSPHVKLPLNLKRSIVAHRLQLEQLMLIGSSSVCPNPGLHRPGRAKICKSCRRLDASMIESMELKTAS